MKRSYGCRILSMILAVVMCLPLLSVGALADVVNPEDVLQVVQAETETMQEEITETAAEIADDTSENVPEEEAERVLTAVVENTAEVLAVSYPAAYPLPALTGNQPQDVVNIAKSQLGYAWDGGTEYCAWWSDVTNYECTASKGWCAVFACWCANKAGVGIGKAYDYNGSSPTQLLRWYKKNAVVDLEHTTDPMPGDFIFIGFSESNVTHVAIVVDYNPNTEIVTYVGGNQQGGRVTTLTISWDADYVSSSGKRLLCYGRPNYDTSYNVALETNGGSCDTVNITCASGSAIGTLPTPMRSGYTFEGWYTAAEGGSLVTRDTVVNGHMSIYAHWKEVSCTITPAAEVITVDMRECALAELALSFSGNLPEKYAVNAVCSADNVATAWKSQSASEAVLEITALAAGYCDVIVSYVDCETGNVLDSVTVAVLVPGNVGTCGESLTWTHEDGTLTVEGSGPMLDYTFDWPPYEALNQETTSVKIEGATTVGNYAFFFFQSLQEVCLSATVTYIGEGAFGECSGLTDVYFEGTAEQWEQLKVSAGEGNECLFAATVHYTGPNNDGVITIADVVQLMKYILGVVTTLDEAVRDPNGDTYTNLQDVVYLVRYLAGVNVEVN